VASLGEGTLPKVTAVMAAFNYAKFIPRTLDSALRQDYPPELLHIVIVDDGSTDGTPDVLADYAARYPDRITVVRQENAGYVAATNRAVAEAQGEVIAILDADDLWPVDKTRRQVQRLLEDDAVGLVYCDTEIIDPYDVVRRKSLWEWWEMKPQRGPDAFVEITSKPGNVALASTIMFRADLNQHIFPIPTLAPYVDWWVTARVAAIAEIDWVPGLKVGYRQHGENLTLGATGMRRVRETLKCAESRRQQLIHGAADHLDEAQLLDAWKAWEGAGLTAVHQAGSAYVPLFPVTDDHREAAVRHIATCKEAIVAGDFRTAFRACVEAVLCNPLDVGAREWLPELSWVAALGKGPNHKLDPLAEARSFVTLAYAEELFAEPQLLSAYASAFGEEDDATLAVAATGMDDASVIREVGEAARRVGLSINQLPDVMLVTQGGAAVRVELERRADAVLTRRAPKLEAPAFAPERVTELRSLIPA
jgi:hypothetical protein